MYFWSRVVPAAPDRWGARYAVTSRHGGVSTGGYGSLNLGGGSGDDPGSVEANRRALAEDLGLPRDRLLFLRQRHTATVVSADGPWAGTPPEADGAVTTRPDLALAALAADCVPVLLADRVAGVVAAVHAGRQGLVNRVVERAVGVMVERGAHPQDIDAVVGPSVCGRCYEVPAAMRDEAAAVSAVSATVSWTGTPAVDVAAGVVDQLTGNGVGVTRVPGCTRESPDLYSYRRDGTTGRFAGVVRLLAPATGPEAR